MNKEKGYGKYFKFGRLSFILQEEKIKNLGSELEEGIIVFYFN